MTFSETQRNNILVSHINTQETESAYTEVVKEDFQAARRIERFSIPLGDLKMLFEKTGTPTNSMKVIFFELNYFLKGKWAILKM